MLQCQRCKSERIIAIEAKCDESCYAIEFHNDKEHNGYSILGGGDFIDLTFCLECGQIQNEFPMMDLI